MGGTALSSARDFSAFMEATAAAMQAVGKGERARAVRRLARHLAEMTGCRRIAWDHADGALPGRYAGWMAERGLAPSTCAAAMGMLRTVLKRAVAEGLLDAMPEFPEDVRYVPRLRKADEFPERVVMERLAALHTDDPRLALTRDMFLFAYYCGGMELADVAALRPANFTGNLLHYTHRAKGREYCVRFDRKAAGIVGRYLFSGDEFLFPVRGTRGGGTTFDNTRRLTDKRLKALGASVGCPGLSFSMNIAASRAQIPRTVCAGVTSVWDRFTV